MKTILIVQVFITIFICQAEKTYKVKSIGLNIRSAPSSNSIILDELKRGDTIIPISYDGNWIGFNFKGDKLGYVNKRFLETCYFNKQTESKSNTQLEEKSFLELFWFSIEHFFILFIIVILISFFKHYLL